MYKPLERHIKNNIIQIQRYRIRCTFAEGYANLKISKNFYYNERG